MQNQMSKSELAMHCSRIAQLAIHRAIGHSYSKTVDGPIPQINLVGGYSDWMLEYRAYQLQWGMDEKEICEGYNQVSAMMMQLGLL